MLSSMFPELAEVPCRGLSPSDSFSQSSLSSIHFDICRDCAWPAPIPHQTLAVSGRHSQPCFFLSFSAMLCDGKLPVPFPDGLSCQKKGREFFPLVKC